MKKFLLNPALLLALGIPLFGLEAAYGLKKHGVGDLLPAFSLRGVDGEFQAIEKLRGDRPMIISFFRSDCKPCEKELPHLQSLHESHGDRLAVVVLTLDTRGHEAFEPFREKHGVTFPVLHDVRNIVSIRLGVKALPMVFLIDEAGVIKETLIGFNTARSDSFKEAMLSKLGF